MSRQYIRRVAAVLAVVLVLWGILSIARRPVQDRDRGLVLQPVDTSLVDSVLIAKGPDTTRLVRSASGEWRVNGMGASSSAISSMLRSLSDSNMHTEVVAERAASHERLGLTADSALHFTVSARGAPVVDLLVGRSTGTYNGVYLRNAGDSIAYSLAGPLTNSTRADLQHWRDTRIAPLSADSVYEIEIRRGVASYTLRREDSTWTFANGRAAATGAVGSLLYQFSNLHATGFATGAEQDSLNFSGARRTARLSDRGGTVIANLMFDSTAAAVFVKSASDTAKTVFRIDAWTYRNLAPAESTLRGG
jgi:hypothetical protein